MEQLEVVLEVEFEGCIYAFQDGFIVQAYYNNCGPDRLYFTRDLKQAKEKLGLYKED